METTHPIRPPAPGLAAMRGETVPLILFVAVAGPPVLLIVAPWVLLALLVAGPFAVVLALVAAVAAATVLAACIVAIVAMPYLLLRRRPAVHRSVVAARLRVEVAA
jgi:hypothetical protein